MRAADFRSRYLWAVAAFFYLPLIYWSGFGLEKGTGLDFPSYYHAARFVFTYRITPYGAHAFDWLPGVTGDHVQPFIYPPPSLLVFWPLRYLELEPARDVFRLLNHLFYLGSAYLVLRLTPFAEEQPRREMAQCLAVAYLFSFDAATATLYLGQINFLVLIFIALALLALQEKLPAWRVALPLSIGIAIKSYPVLLIPVLLFRRQFRAAGLTVLFFASFAGVATLVLPRGIWSSWVSEALPAGGYANDLVHAGFAFNQSLNGFTMRLFRENFFSQAPLLLPWLAKPAAIVLASIASAVTVYSSLRMRRSGSGNGAESAAYLLLIYLIAPLSWDHHLVFLLPAALLALSLVAGGSVPWRAALFVVGALLVIAWRIPLGAPQLTQGWGTLWISVKLYGVLVLWAFFIARMRESATERGAPFARSRLGEAGACTGIHSPDHST